MIKVMITATKKCMFKPNLLYGNQWKCQKYSTYLKDGKQLTSMILLQNDNQTEDKNQANYTKMSCQDGTTIGILLRNDLIFDCGLEGEDEPILMSLLNNRMSLSCMKPDMFPCMDGHSKCYNIRDICTYKLYMYGHLIP